MNEVIPLLAAKHEFEYVIPLHPQTGSHCSVQKVVESISDKSIQLVVYKISEQASFLAQLNVVSNPMVI